MDTTIPYLFVYGTLMTSASSALGRAQRVRLGREAASLGPATIAGRIWDFGRYPGLVASPVPEDLVHGEVLELASPARSLAWLDAYEGIMPGPRARSRYERVTRPVRLAAGRPLEAWVYVYARDVTGGRPLPHGRWPAAR